MIEQLRTLCAHLDWADRRAVGALQAAKQPPAKAVEIMSHVLGAEAVWLSRLQQRKAEVAVWPALSVEGCVELAVGNRQRLEDYLGALTERDLDKSVAYTNSAGQCFESKVWDILLHVAMHGSYHRGQVMLLLRESGNEPAASDYIAFVRGAPAATRQR